MDLLHKMVAWGLTPSHAQFNAVIDAQAKCQDGSAADALRVLDQMHHHGAAPNIVSYSTCIDAQAKRGDGSAATAARLLDQLLARNLKPDIVTFAGVIDAQAKRKDGKASTAVAILDKMAAFVAPNQIHFNSTLNACANQRPSAVDLAEQVLAKMLARDFTPNQYTMSALLRCAGFASPPRPDLARAWFLAFCRDGSVAVNDHVERALRNALPDVAGDLLAGGAGALPTSAAASPLTSRRSMTRVIQRGSSTPTLGRRANSFESGNWRGGGGSSGSNGGDGGAPSSSLFATPRRCNSGLLDAPASQTQRGGGDGQPTSSLFCTPRRNSGMLDLRQPRQNDASTGAGGSSQPGPSSSLFRTPRRGSSQSLNSGGTGSVGSLSWQSPAPAPAPAPPSPGLGLSSKPPLLGDTPMRLRGSLSDVRHTRNSRAGGGGGGGGAGSSAPFLAGGARTTGSLCDLKLQRAGSTLMAKMQQLKQQQQLTTQQQQRAGSSDAAAPGIENSAMSAPAPGSPAGVLLGPDAFSSPKATPRCSRRVSQTNIRQPSGPDGTRGFKGTRRSSMPAMQIGVIG